MNNRDAMAKWAQFDDTIPWMRREGVRLMATSRRYGVQDDYAGRLIPLKTEDIVIGRDDHRIAKIVKVASDNLALHMRVQREDVIGRNAPLKGRLTRKRYCQCRLVGERIVKPAPFVTYLTPQGRIRYYRLEASE